LSERGRDAIADIRLRGLRLWVSSLTHWPVRQLRGHLDATEHRLEEIREDIQAELERRALRFEKVAAAWAATALLIAIAGCFFLLGLWLGFARLFGPVAASFLLACIFVVLAPIPVIILGKLFPAHSP
jgi:hypothetical protein